MSLVTGMESDFENVLHVIRGISGETRKKLMSAHILPNIPRSIGNQTMKFGQLIINNII